MPRQETERTPHAAPAISVIVPAYDEAERLAATLESLHRSLERAWPDDFEIVVVDDGSGDGTFEVAMDVADRLPHCRVMGYTANRGKGHALRTGFTAARGDVVAFIDADGEVAVEQLAPMILAAQRGASVVVGRRRWRTRRPPLRRVASRLVSFAAATVFRLSVEESQAGIKAFVRADVESAVEACREDGFLFDLELLVRANREGLTMLSMDVATTTVRPCRIGVWAGAREMAHLVRVWWRLGPGGGATRPGRPVVVADERRVRARPVVGGTARHRDGGASTLMARPSLEEVA